MSTHEEKMLSFEEALRVSEELLQDLEEAPSDCLIEQLNELLSRQGSCRGFFVVLLTGESKLADQLPEYLLEALRKSSQVPELLVKNLVMSSTMELTHKRQGDLEKAAGSQLVAARSAAMISALKSDELRDKLIEMKSSIKLGTGVFADFLRRWSYDQEQLQRALAVIENQLT